MTGGRARGPCTGCGTRRRLHDGLCSVCDRRAWSPIHTGPPPEARATRNEREREAMGRAATAERPRRDAEHAAHLAAMVLVRDCRACDDLAHRLPARPIDPGAPSGQPYRRRT